MIIIIYFYKRLFEEIGGKLQKSKIISYYWKQNYVDKIKIIKYVPINREIYENQIKELKTFESMRVLGIYIFLNLKQIK